jgi:DNA polymerase-3 subunit epsilon
VLRIDDVTTPLEAGSRTEAILRSLTDASRRALANIRAAVETLLSFPGMEPERAARFVGVIHEEAAALSATLDRSASDPTSLRTEWLLEDMLGTDLVSAARARIESTLGLSTVAGAVDPAVQLKVDSYSLVRAIVSIASRLEKEGVRELRFALQPAGRRAHLDLAWSGADIATETLSRWEDQPLETNGEPFPLTLKEVVERHDGAVWYQASRASASGFFRLAFPVSRAEQAPLVLPIAARARPEYYDFDLFHQAGQTPELDERKLTDIAYTVFDTETTGLSPSDGDEIISIGAVAHREWAAPAPGGVRAIRGSQEARFTHDGSNHRHRSCPARGQADDRSGPPPVPPVLRGHGARGAQRRVRHAVPAAQGGGVRRPLHPSRPRHAVPRRGDPA